MQDIKDSPPPKLVKEEPVDDADSFIYVDVMSDSDKPKLVKEEPTDDEDYFICVDELSDVDNSELVKEEDRDGTTDIEMNYTDNAENDPLLFDDVPTQGSRAEQSLGYLTKRFMNCIENRKDNQCDLNEIAETLGMKRKRRLYDITNVLEGAGVIEKGPNNTMNFMFDEILNKEMSPETHSELEAKVAKKKEEIAELDEEERLLDEKIRLTKMNIREFLLGQDAQSHFYQRPEDVVEAFGPNKTFAIRFSEGTALSIPPEKHLHNFNLHQLKVKSRGLPLEGHYITSIGDEGNENFCSNLFEFYGRMSLEAQHAQDKSENKEYCSFYPPPGIGETDEDFLGRSVAVPLSPPANHQFPQPDPPFSLLELYGDDSDGI